MRTRPGIDRITKQELTAAKAWLEGRMSAHLKQCMQCKQSGERLRDRCATWWRLARHLHRVKRKLLAYEQPETANIDQLPGMEGV